MKIQKLFTTMIKRLQLRPVQLQAGFTFVELLVSMMILMVVGSIILVVFFSSLRGTGRSQALITLRQNGNYALSQMTKNIRQAALIVDEASCTETKAESVTVVSPFDSAETTYRCTESGIASISATQTYYLVDTTDDVTISACSFTCGRHELSDVPYVQLDFTLETPESRAFSAEDPFSFSATVLLRNYRY